MLCETDGSSRFSECRTQSFERRIALFSQISRVVRHDLWRIRWRP